MSENVENKEDLSTNEDTGDSEDFSVEIELPEDSDSNEQEESNSEETPQKVEDHKTEYGKRAQKRIRGLVSRAKELEQEVENLRKSDQEKDSQIKELSTRTTSQEEQSLNETEGRVKAQLESSRRAYREARESDNMDAEMEAMEKVSQANAQLLALQARRRFIEAQKGSSEESSEEDTTQDRSQSADGDTNEPQVDEKTKAWVERNPWINAIKDPDSYDQEDVEMAQLAGRLHNYATGVLLLNPAEDADEYWSTIDNGLKEQYPHRFTEQDVEEEEEEDMAEEQSQPRQKVASPRTPTRSKGKRKVKATPKEVEFSKKYNVPLDRIVRERIRLESEAQ